MYIRPVRIIIFFSYTPLHTMLYFFILLAHTYARMNIIMYPFPRFHCPFLPLLKKYVLQHRYDSASQRFSFKILQKNSGIYLDVMYKVSTFAPALLERQSLMIDILLKSKGSENKNKKLSKKFGGYLKKSLSLHPLSQRKQARRKPRQFFEILINNTSSTS